MMNNENLGGEEMDRGAEVTTDWSVIGLDSSRSEITINEKDYVLDKKNAVLVHAILCLVTAVENTSYEIRELGRSIKALK